ncbi:MAG: TonB-dependent receptor [Gemmatimonadaceae bacterium]|nr:TonB-dependent receptor [Gemmatimonadaceae bacterium]
MSIGHWRRALATLLLAHPVGLAAAATPALVGTVKSDAGTPLPNVAVVLVELGRTTTTDANGGFTLRGIPAGRYHLTTHLIGFAAKHVDIVMPAAGPDVRVNIQMTETVLQLQAVVVAAAPGGGDPHGATQAVAELSGKALSRTIGSSVAQTLVASPGVAMRYNGPNAAMPVIRGLTGDRILVLQDGERSGDLASSAPDHSVAIDPLAAQRIEVVRGPAALLYGNNALGGVVNVVSNDLPSAVPSHVEGTMALQAESVNPGGALHGSVTAPIAKNWAVAASGSARHTGDVRQGGGVRMLETDALNLNGTMALGYVTDRSNGGVVLRGYDFDYGLPAEAGSDEVGVRIRGRRLGATGRATFNPSSARFPYAKLEASALDYRHDEVEPDGNIGTSFHLQTQTATATVKTTAGPWHGTLGAQGLFKQYSASGEEALTPAANSNALGLFAYQEVALAAAANGDARVPRIQAGLRYDYYGIASQVGDRKFGAAQSRRFDNLTGSFGVAVPLSARWSTSASVARAFRAPTVEELFSNAYHFATASYEQGTASLKAEHNVGVDGVLKFEGARANAQIAGYVNRVSDFITVDVTGDTVYEGNTVPLARYRQGDATLRGIEGQAEWRVGQRWVAGASGDLTRGAFARGGDLPFIPAARLGASMRWDDGKRTFGGDVRHAFAQDRTSGGPVDVVTGAYTVVNVSAGWNVIVNGRVHSFTVRADNVGDVRFFDAASRIKSYAANPGRNLSLVYKVVF